MTGEKRSTPFLQSPANERWGAFSPDGRWVAYHSDESGRNEVYVRPFVAPGDTEAAARAAGVQWQLSADGGIYAVWSRDGREVYYLDPSGRMMAVAITVSNHILTPGKPAVLFPTRIFGGGLDVRLGRQYDVAPDGRFLITQMLDSVATPITLLMNWAPPSAK